MSNKRKTLSVKPYGRLPLQDAKEDARVPVRPKHMRRGKRNSPSGCALALGNNDAPEGTFPGDYLASRVNKTHTVVIATINNRVQARRYAHDEATRKAINDFDDKKPCAFPPEGLIVTLLAPRGSRKAGTYKASKNTGAKRSSAPRVSRTVYRYDVDRVAAQRTAKKEAAAAA